MKTKARSVNRIIEEQIQRWHISRSRPAVEKTGRTVLAVSREPGSGGSVIARRVAQTFGCQMFHREVIHAMARRAEVSDKILETLDEKGLSVLEDWISSLVYDRHIWPDEYLQHLMKIVGVIGRHGGAVIVGRGANFILPPEACLRLRVVAPQKRRIENVAREFGVTIEEARRRVIRTDSDRRAFVRKYFNADIADPIYYDLVINTDRVSVAEAVAMVSAAMGIKKPAGAAEIAVPA
jgi:cytidylate kinase